jgi:signal peptidase I
MPISATIAEVPKDRILQFLKALASGGTVSAVDTPRGAVAEWTVTILLLLFGTTTLVQAFVIPTGSMEDNLLIGDHLLVDKLSFAPAGAVSRYLLPYLPIERGDIIVFRYPEDVRQTFVKRVVGVPGDRIRIVNKQVLLNGKPIEEPYKFHKQDFLIPYRDNFPDSPPGDIRPRGLDMLASHLDRDEIVVPPDSYFAMGDNRDFSLDSRYWGFVPRDHIVGKPLIIYWSYETETNRLISSGIDLEHIKDLALNFFRKTRWKRTFHLIRGYPL